MSNVGNNPIMATVSGKLSNVVVYRRVRGKLIMCKPPKKRHLLTPHQADKKERFLEAVQYAKAMMADDVNSVEYQAGITNRLTSGYSVALTDYLKSPEIKLINTSNYNGALGDILEIKATDDFKVLSVEVEIRDAANKLIERGFATLREHSQIIWLYKITAANAVLAGTHIVVKAKDKPGNVTIAEKLLA
jgi:hypothetical protein